jgi:hypothetical protein
MRIELTPAECTEIRKALGYVICKVGQRRRRYERLAGGGRQFPDPDKERSIYEKRGARIERLEILITKFREHDEN